MPIITTGGEIAVDMGDRDNKYAFMYNTSNSKIPWQKISHGAKERPPGEVAIKESFGAGMKPNIVDCRNSKGEIVLMVGQDPIEGH